MEGNAFNAVQWQLYDSEGKFVKTFESQRLGFHESDYVFPYESGNYSISLKANSNKQDEAVRTPLQLDKDKKYHYSFDVSILEEKKVIVKNVTFGIKKW